MTSQRPYFPFDEIDVPSLSYPRFTAEEVCGWDTFITAGDCKTGEVVFDIYAKAEWLPVTMEVNKVKSDDGLGGQITDSVRVDPVYSVRIYVDEYIRWYMWKMFTQSTKLTFEKDTNDIEGQDIDVQESEVSDGVHLMTISFKAVASDSYHGEKGIDLCCEPLYTEAPYESCDENPGDIENDVPPCDTVEFDIAATGDNVDATVSGTPGAYTIAWYHRFDETLAWSLIIADATGVVMGSYGIYRAVLNAVGCGQYIRQYVKEDPCANLSVKLRSGTGGSILAQIPDGISPTYAWEYNDGMGWVDLPDTTQTIVAENTGNYRVTVVYGDCERQDIIYLIVNGTICDFDVDIIVTGGTATADTDAGSPTYQWVRENESGMAIISTLDNIAFTSTGVYWLYVTSDGCTKSSYVYFKANEDNKDPYCAIENATGFEFVVYGINLLTTDPTDIEVTVDGLNMTFTASLPTLASEWSFNADGKIIFSEVHALENSLIVIHKV